MSNSVTTIIRAKDQEILKKVIKVADVREKENEWDDTFDFNVFIRMPENSDVFLRHGNLGSAEEEKFGNNNWYHWAIKNWGTKWNAYAVKISTDAESLEDDQEWENYICFQTAWNHPELVIVAMSKMYPETEFWIQYADEDLGRNFGEYWIKNGEIIKKTNFRQHTREADMFTMAITSMPQ